MKIGRLLFRVFKYAAFLVFVALLVLILYLNIRGVPDKYARQLIEPLQFEGTVLRWDKIKLSILEGIIATHVHCFRKGDIGQPVFEAEKIVLHLSPLAWLRGKPCMVGASTKGGIVRLTIENESKEAGTGAVASRQIIVIENIHASLRLDQPPVIRVVDLTAEIMGFKISGRGDLLIKGKPDQQPSTPHSPSAAETTNTVTQDISAERKTIYTRAQLHGLLQWIKRVHLNKAVNIDVDFMIDPDDIETLELTIKINIRSLALEQSFLSKISSEIMVRGKTGEGKIQATDCTISGIWMKTLEGRFHFDEGSLRIEKLAATIGQGAMKGPFSFDLVYDLTNQQYEGRFSSAFYPSSLLPAFNSFNWSNKNIIKDFTFSGSAPSINGRFDGNLGSNWYVRVGGNGLAEKCSYKNVSTEAMQTSFVLQRSATNFVFTLSPLTVKREEGSVFCRLTQDPPNKQISFEGVVTANPASISKMINPLTERIVNYFRFEGPTRVVGSGIVDYGNTNFTDIDLFIEGSQVGWSALLAEHFSLNLNVLADNIEIPDIEGTIYGGLFKGRVSISPTAGSSNRHYQVDAEVEKVDLESLLNAVGGNKLHQPQGTLSGIVEVQGLIGPGMGNTASGHGRVDLSGSHIFQIPLFGGLSHILSKIIPGLGMLISQTDATAQFIIQDGKIHSDQIQIDGNLLSLSGSGDYYFDGQLDFKIQVKLLRKDTVSGELLRFVTWPVSKILEFHLGGTFDEPRWRPVNLPKEMFFIFD